MFACCFLRKLWERMHYPPTLTDEKGACFCPLSVGEGVAWRGWTSFICWEDENWRFLGADIFT